MFRLNLFPQKSRNVNLKGSVMKKLLVSIALLFSIVPAYAMEAPGEKGEVGGGKRVVVEKKKKAAAAEPVEKAEEEPEERAVMKFPHVYFSPNTIQDVLIKLISEESRQLRGAWYRFTLYKPAQAIVEAITERKVKVSFVIDQGNFGDSKEVADAKRARNAQRKKERKFNEIEKVDEGDFCEGLALIASNDGKIYRKRRPRHPQNPGKFEIMHHKFMIFESTVAGKLVGTGSFNGTGQANQKSDENWVVLDDPDVIKKFEKEHQELVAFSDNKPLRPEECASEKTRKADGQTNWSRRMNGIPC